MHNIILYLFLLIVVAACSSKETIKENENEATLEFSKYENEFYSLEYPSHWKVVEDIRDKAEGFEDCEGNDKMTLQQHEVDLISYDGLSFHIVKSNFHFDLPVDDYADISVLTKGLADAGKYQDDINYNLEKDPKEYLDFWRYDSVPFAGRRAVLLAFKLVTEYNDTLIQKQIVVQNGKGDTFYVNSTFAFGDDSAQELGDIIFESFKLK